MRECLDAYRSSRNLGLRDSSDSSVEISECPEAAGHGGVGCGDAVPLPKKRGLAYASQQPLCHCSSTSKADMHSNGALILGFILGSHGSSFIFSTSTVSERLLSLAMFRTVSRGLPKSSTLPPKRPWNAPITPRPTAPQSPNPHPKNAPISPPRLPESHMRAKPAPRLCAAHEIFPDRRPRTTGATLHSRSACGHLPSGGLPGSLRLILIMFTLG